MTKPYRVEAKPVGSLLISKIKNMLERRGFVDPQIIHQWPSIMASISQLGRAYQSVPIKIANIKNKGRVLFVSSSDLSFKADFTYKKSAIMAKVNKMYSANKQVVDVKIT